MVESDSKYIEDAFSDLEIGKQIIKKLEEIYNEKFTVLKIAKKYAEGDFDHSVAICSPANNKNIMFNVLYDMVEEKIAEDDFFIKCTCFELEEYIVNAFKNNNIEVIVKVEIFGKKGLERKYSVQEFTENYEKNNFLATIIVKDNISQIELEDVFKNINDFYKNIYLKTLIYVIQNDEYEKCYNRAKNLTNLSMSFIRDYNVKNEYIMKIYNNEIIKVK